MKRDAEWWTKKNGKIKCLLCPHLCELSPGESGICGVRKAGKEGKLKLPAYGMISAESADPVEKKPLYHFHPGESVWSVGFTGCNMLCPFCQNFRISRAEPGIGRFKNPEEVVSETFLSGSRLLAFTYSEATVHYEFLLETASAAHEAGLKTILVTNGNLNPKPAGELLSLMDGVNIDLKSWNSVYYNKVLGGNLPTVKAFIEEAAARCWVEITTLVIPEDNDAAADITAMSRWIASISKDIPYHLSAYYPSYKYSRAPTRVPVLKALGLEAAKELNYVYLGNTGIENNTHCPNCSKVVIQRKSYRAESLLIDGKCPVCGTKIPGVFPRENFSQARQ